METKQLKKQQKNNSNNPKDHIERWRKKSWQSQQAW